MRARLADKDGFVARDGINLYYEIYGDGDPTLVLVPTWCLIHSRAWKMQIPYLSRHYRVVTYDPRGNGKSGRPRGKSEHSWHHYVDDILAVMDATGTTEAVLVGLSMSGLWSNIAAVLHPDRVMGVVSLAPPAGLGIVLPHREVHSYTDVLDTDEDWAKDNVHFIRDHYREYVEWFATKIFSDPHSTKQIEDNIAWSLETDADSLIDSDLADVRPQEDMASFYSRFTTPLLLIHGDADLLVAHESSVELARLTGGTLVTFRGSGHGLPAREPVRVNLLIRDFVERVAA